MRMSTIYLKLRKHNMKHYYMLIFCTILSIVLVTSYGTMFLSPTVQSILPSGGDSNKQAYMIFCIAIMGCVFFTTYASSLFFKYKSRQSGILLSLGATKFQLRRALYRELLLITSMTTITGIALSIPISYGIWKLFQLLIIDSKEMTYTIGWSGITFGLMFSLFLTLCIFIKGHTFIRRTHIMDILNEHHKSESVKDVKSWYGIVGIVLVFAGMLLGYLVPHYAIKYFHYFLPSAWNLTFLLTVIGLYMVITYAIIHHRRGSNLRKYYRQLLPKSMMKFMGKQTIRTMCVITLLIIGALFAIFYVPTTVSGIFYSIYNNPIDYSFHYKMTESQISKDDIYGLAKDYDVTILSYDEAMSISLIVNGYTTYLTDGRKIVYDYQDKIGYGEFISVSDYNRVSGHNIHLASGEYRTIITPNHEDSIYRKVDDLNRITSPVTSHYTTMIFTGTIVYSPLCREDTTKYILSDEDYRLFSIGLPLANYENFVLFNVADPYSTYAYANALKNQLIMRSSDDVAVPSSYDAYERELMIRKEGSYYYDKKLDLSGDNNGLFMDWKYYPVFNVLNRQDLIKNMAVFLMLFVYISIICFTAVGIIGYTRSTTIALNNRDFFFDLHKLGAGEGYIHRCITSQLKKIFFLPTACGSIIIFLFYSLIMYGNDEAINTSECIALGINAGVLLIAILFMYIIYKLSYGKFKRIIST